MRVLVLCHELLIPPKVVKFKNDINRLHKKPWRTEFFVSQALMRLGHEVRFCGLDASLDPLKHSLNNFRPDVVFNLLEEFSGERALEPFVVSYLEKIKQPMTGNKAIGLILAKNKLAAKKILDSKNILVPGNQKFPKIVKLADEESSFGISEKSIVKNRAEERKQVKNLKKKFNRLIFSEEYIDGREIHVAVIRINGKQVTTPIWETNFGRKRGAMIISERVKWDIDFQLKMGIHIGQPKNLSNKVIRKIKKIALACCRALSLNSYARVDMRLTPDNKIYVLEVNPNPDIGQEDEFSKCVESLGYPYDKMIQSLLSGATK